MIAVSPASIPEIDKTRPREEEKGKASRETSWNVRTFRV